jgi:hypothetical protein
MEAAEPQSRYRQDVISRRYSLDERTSIMGEID